MANEEYLSLLLKGVVFWNQWRDQTWNNQVRNKQPLIDLRGASLNSQNLSSANFCLVDLTGADLSESNLIGSYFLSANLSDATLTKTGCKGAYFSDTILRRANFKDASLLSADLSRSDLTEACLENANLTAVRAIQTNFSRAKLTGACIEDWQINKAILDEVDCRYIYIKKDKKEKLRCPSDRDFLDGEFSKRFQISQNFLEIFFNDGVPWNSFSHAFNEVNLQVLDEFGSELFLQEYKVLGEGFVTIKVSYPPDANGQRIRDSLKQKTNELELKVAGLEGEIRAKDHTLRVFERLLSSGFNRFNSKSSRIYIDGIDSFEEVKSVVPNSILNLLDKNGYLDIPEEKIQIGLEKILDEKFHKKDWAGEYNDLYTTNLFFDGNRIATAFLLKGNGLKAINMEIKHCGKNGDQLIRLFESPAELFVVQFVGNISEAVVKDIEGKVERIRAQGKQAYYCVMNGSDTARLLYAYELI